MTASDDLARAREFMGGALPMPLGSDRCYRSAPKPADAETPLAVLEQQLADLRVHALQHLAERGLTPTGDHWEQWHAFLDIDPDLRGRNYQEAL